MTTMIGMPKYDEPLTLGESLTAWRIGLRRRWTVRNVMLQELGPRALAAWDDGRVPRRVVPFASRTAGRAEAAA
jgi:hypothetical protein